MTLEIRCTEMYRGFESLSLRQARAELNPIGLIWLFFCIRKGDFEMRKRLTFICFSLLSCLMIFSSCSKDKNYQTDVFEYIPNYKNTTCNVLKDKNIELHIESSVSNSKDEISALIGFMQDDYSILTSVFHLDTKIKCYVIADEYILGNDKAVYQNDVLICNESAIKDGGYKKSLVGAYIQSTEYWKQYGAYAYAFHFEYSNEELKQYYANGKDLELTLFSAYFIDDFYDNTRNAIETACSFSNFVISTYGYNNFINANLTDYRAEYLSFLGVDRALNIPFDLSWLDGAIYSQNFLSYPLVIRTANRVYNLDAFSSKRETASFDTPERVLYHLSAGNVECAKILNYIKSNAPDSFDFVNQKYFDKLEYFISDREIKTCCDVNNRKIYLLDPSEYVHETIHAVTLKSNATDEAWIAEGMAEYLSRYVSRHISDINNRFYSSFTDKTLTGSIADFVSEVNALYENSGGKFDHLNDFDFALLAKCIGETTLKNSGYKSQIKFPYATDPIYKNYACTIKGGNVLTYPEAYAFTCYLIEKYGFSNVLKCCINYNFYSVFGSDYVAIMDDFMKSIV